MYSQYLLFGSIAKDEIVFVPESFSNFIDPNQPSQLNFSFLANHVSLSLGGIATNIAYSLAPQISKPVYILGGVGSLDSQPFMDLFNKNNIHTDYLIIDQEKLTGTYKAITDKDNNQIGGFYYGANEASISIQLASIPEYQNSLLVLSSNHPEAFYQIQSQAIELGIDYIYDIGMALSWINVDRLKQGCLNAKYIIVNKNEDIILRKETGLTIEDFLDNKVTYIVTKGGDGVDYFSPTEIINLPAINNITVVDPTGAGDAFRSGFIAGLELGLSPQQALCRGSAVACICLAHNGAVSHSLGEDKILQLSSSI
jgi:adenosine kinase